MLNFGVLELDFKVMRNYGSYNSFFLNQWPDFDQIGTDTSLYEVGGGTCVYFSYYSIK